MTHNPLSDIAQREKPETKFFFFIILIFLAFYVFLYRARDMDQLPFSTFNNDAYPTPSLICLTRVNSNSHILNAKCEI
ncbi:hypothetical protein PUN28_015573 [Cardiocondyla obscurior]|uniref:ATP synthase F0 subunit 8 n=1 Tax=Cardiocondyla obscurior TaxID=286306 RepID=A0AAW2EXK9_9HYME